MLARIGIRSLEELFAVIPEEVRLKRPLHLPPPLTELELEQHLRQLARQNRGASEAVCFLGGGSYDHFIPAVVDALAGRSEFYTAYTPYQAEASQGSLQAFFEYQTLICQLMGLEVSNASLYEGGSALAEAVLMALGAAAPRRKVVVAASVHPEYRQVLHTYLAEGLAEWVPAPAPAGFADPDDVRRLLDEHTACLVVQHPNFFGCLEEVADLGQLCQQRGVLFVVSCDPISLGLLKRPGDYGADIAVAEGQALGIPLSYGGPYLGILACRQAYLRRLPGRLVGQTVDQNGRRCWVLTLQTREQHIRREKATSNICTNQGLMALRAAIYLAALGPQGLRETAELCLRKAHYAAEQLRQQAGLPLRFSQPFFKEFTVRVPGKEVSSCLKYLLHAGYHGGLALGRWYPQLADCVSIAVTEQRTRAEIDGLARAWAQAQTEVS